MAGRMRPGPFVGRPDPTRGGNAGYQYLKTLASVRPDRIGVIGHSLGAMSAVATASLNPDHRAVNSQCGPAGSPSLHNVLLTQAKYRGVPRIPRGPASHGLAAHESAAAEGVWRIGRVSTGTRPTGEWKTAARGGSP